MTCKCDLQSTGELVQELGDFNWHVGRHNEGFEHVHGGNGIDEKNVEGRMLLEFCNENGCVEQTHGIIRKRKEKWQQNSDWHCIDR